MMFSKNENFTPPPPPVGVIESLTQGFETVAGHLALLLLPLLLDILLWVGPRVSFSGAIQTVVDLYYHDFWTPFVTSVNPDMEAFWEEIAQTMASGLGGMADQYFPFTSFIVIPILPAPGLPTMPLIGLPSLLATREATTMPFNYIPPVWQIQSVEGMVGLKIAATLGGLLLGSIYIALIAHQIQPGEKNKRGSFLLRLPLIIIQIFVFGVTAPLLLVLIFMPFLIMALGLNVISPLLATFAIQLGFVTVLWIGMFGVFTVHGMLMNKRNLLKAAWDSVRVVQWNMSSTLLLFLLVLLLNWALTFLWREADTDSWLVLVAIGAHAFISTGLIAATFTFFKDRYRYWQEMREALLAELEKQRIQQESNHQTAE